MTTKYEDAIAALKTARTLTAHITGLAKLQTKVEDDRLSSLLSTVILDLRTAHANAAASKTKVRGKTTPGNLYSATNPSIVDLIKYCEALIGTKKPEWQVMAERHGWTPPNT